MERMLEQKFLNLYFYNIFFKMLKLANELAEEKQSYERWENKYADLQQEYIKYRYNVEVQMNEKEQELENIKLLAKDLEKENNEVLFI